MANNYYVHIQRNLRRLSLCQAGRCLETWPIAIGKPATPTPLGYFTIVSKVLLDGTQVYGTHWLGLSLPRYGIHGTNNPASIGQAVSLGCIRMQNHDIRQLFEYIAIGNIVNITQL